MAISLVTIMQNEEEALPAFLENIKGEFPENIFIDGGSTDSSIELVEREGYGVFHREFNYDFAAQKNYGLHLASNQWRMILDVDELLSVGMKHLFRMVNVKMEEDPLTGWSFLRDNYIDGNFVDIFPPDQQIRLISDQIYLVGKVHEKPQPKDPALGPNMAYRVYDGGRIFHRKTSFRQYRNNFIYEMVVRGKTEVPKGIGCYMEGIRGQGGKFRVVILEDLNPEQIANHYRRWYLPENEQELIKKYGLDTYEI